MMMFLLGLVFMTPLCFFSYWIFLFILLIMSLMFLVKMSFNYLYLYISYFLGIDLLSFTLIMLSFWICVLMIMASEKLFKLDNFYSLYLFMNLMLMISLYLAFSSLNLFIFYLFFEISLIPTLILIIGWGYQPERLTAGVYLLFYTLLMSLPMMVALFYFYMKFYSLEFYFFYSINSLILYYCANMVFFVKIPMFIIHLWLPKAHVEAPISGSMILAGVMLKLGGGGGTDYCA